jgi:hypothetical protein
MFTAKPPERFLKTGGLALCPNNAPVRENQHRQGCRTGMLDQERRARFDPAIIHPRFMWLGTNWVDRKMALQLHSKAAGDENRRLCLKCPNEHLGGIVVGAVGPECSRVERTSSPEPRTSGGTSQVRRSNYTPALSGLVQIVGRADFCEQSQNLAKSTNRISKRVVLRQSKAVGSRGRRSECQA